MITEDYVSLETAKLLKEKGFDELTPLSYRLLDGFPQKITCRNSFEEKIVSRVTLQMAMKWLREVHKLHIVILWDCGAYTGNNSFYYHIDRIDNYEDKGYNKVGFDSNEEACEAAIKYCLENLI